MSDKQPGQVAIGTLVEEAMVWANQHGLVRIML